MPSASPCTGIPHHALPSLPTDRNLSRNNSLRCIPPTTPHDPFSLSLYAALLDGICFRRALILRRTAPATSASICRKASQSGPLSQSAGSAQSGTHSQSAGNTEAGPNSAGSATVSNPFCTATESGAIRGSNRLCTKRQGQEPAATSHGTPSR
ncbi:hypothetical protein T484DRAFT_3064135 [Baffinella frigidus]|nr:hypothetical protein T484DRAFT_3064135 [Cryptophyta sp. CCMP2293]